MAGRRVLITGVANAFGTRLAHLLAADAGVERVVGVDTRPVDPGLAARIDVVAADLRSAELPPLVRAAAVDTVVHNDIVQFPEPGRPRASLHDVNVIGTLQLLTVCEGLPTLRAIVVRGSAAIYGSEAGAPAFFTEDGRRPLSAAHPLPARHRRARAARRRLRAAATQRSRAPCCACSRSSGAASTRRSTACCARPVVPTMLGYDPRVQLLDADDAVGALRRAVLHPVRGPVNVAADGVVSLSRALRHARRPAVPIAAPLWGTLVGTARRAARQPALPDEIGRYLRFGRGVDTTRMRRELGFRPEHSTLEALARAAGAA